MNAEQWEREYRYEHARYERAVGQYLEQKKRADALQVRVDNQADEIERLRLGPDAPVSWTGQPPTTGEKQ